MNQPLWLVRFVNIAAVSVCLVYQQQAFDLSDLSEVLSRLYASQCACRTVLFAAVCARLSAWRIHFGAIAAQVALDRNQVLGSIDRRRYRVRFYPQEVLKHRSETAILFSLLGSPRDH